MDYKINTSVGIFNVRGLKHRELKELNFRERSKDEKNAEPMQEEVFQKVLCQEDIDRMDELTEYERVALYIKILGLTFMTDEQRKNFNWQWESTIPIPTVPVTNVE